jgi:hypothetical protein
LGPYRIATVLENNGYTTFVLDFAIDFTTDELCKAVGNHLDYETLWVGFSSTFFFAGNNKDDGMDRLNEMYYAPYNQIKVLMDYVKTHSTAKLIYGGAKSAFYNVDNNIDYYVIGYADNSVLALTDYLSNKTVNDPGRIIDSATYPEPTVDNISTDWSKHPVLTNESLPLELARGCIFKCKFCSYPLLGKKKGTYIRSIDQVRDDMISAWETHGTTGYYMTDDTFNDDNEKIEQLHRMFTSLPFKPKFSAYLRIDLLNKYPHQADLLTEMGLIGTFFGLETMQADSAKAIGKGMSPNKVKDRLYWLAERWQNKCNISSGFILGLPYDDVFYFDQLIEWCLEKDNPIQHIEIYPLYLFNHADTTNKIPYLSEFSLNPEIYGYQFPGVDNSNYWKLPKQHLSFDMCTEISNSYKTLLQPRNKFAGFSMLSLMNIGVELSDMYELTSNQIVQKYNIAALNSVKLAEYKNMLGLKVNIG